MRKLFNWFHPYCWFYMMVAVLFTTILLLGCNQPPQDSCSSQCDTCPSGSCGVVEPETPVLPELETAPLFLPPQIETPIPPPPPEFSPVESWEVSYEDYLRATCRIRGGGSGGSGTCYKIDDQYVYVLTCRHVVGKTKDFTAEFWIDGKVTGKYAGKVSKILDVDAAVILIPVNSFKEGELPVAIPISRAAPNKSEPIVSVGSPGLGWQTLFEGHITKMNKKSKQSFEFIPPPKGGRSGSAILQGGKIVGVLWGTTKERGYAVTCMDLQSLNEVSNLFFAADWCKYCEQMKPVVEALKESGCNVQIIDYDLNTAFAELYGINSLPAYVNTQGETISGVKSTEELREFYQ